MKKKNKKVVIKECKDTPNPDIVYDPQLLERIQGEKKHYNYEILQALAAGNQQSTVAKLLGVNKSTICRIVAMNEEVLNYLTFKVCLSSQAGRLRLLYNMVSQKKIETKYDLVDLLREIRAETTGGDGLRILNIINTKGDNGNTSGFTGEDAELQARLLARMAEQFEK